MRTTPLREAYATSSPLARSVEARALNRGPTPIWPWHLCSAPVGQENLTPSSSAHSYSFLPKTEHLRFLLTFRMSLPLGTL